MFRSGIWQRLGVSLPVQLQPVIFEKLLTEAQLVLDGSGLSPEAALLAGH